MSLIDARTHVITVILIGTYDLLHLVAFKLARHLIDFIEHRSIDSFLIAS